EGGTDANAQGKATGRGEYYKADDGQLFERALPHFLYAGEGDLLGTKYEYFDNGDRVVTTSPRDVTTTTDFDGAGHAIHVSIAGNESNPDEHFGYDARGRLRRHARQQGSHLVEDRYEYDLAGRETRHELYDSGALLETTTTSYDMGQRVVTTTLPTGSTITTHLDVLGRVTIRETDPKHPNATSIVEQTAYDIEGNLV